MDKFVKFIATSNRLIGKTGQIALYIIAAFQLLFLIRAADPGRVYYVFLVVATVLLILLLAINVFLLIVTVILIFMHKVEDDASFDREKSDIDVWSAIIMGSSVIIPFLAWFGFLRDELEVNDVLCALIWAVQFSMLFNSYFYKAFLKQYLLK